MTKNESLRIGRAAPGIPVSDIARATEFYGDIFGFEKVFENGDPVGFVILKRDEAEIHLTLVKSHRGATHNVMHLMVSDADEVHARCEKHGARILKGIRNAPWGLRTFVMADLDGNRIDVGQRLRDA